MGLMNKNCSPQIDVVKTRQLLEDDTFNVIQRVARQRHGANLAQAFEVPSMRTDQCVEGQRQVCQVRQRLRLATGQRVTVAERRNVQ